MVKLGLKPKNLKELDEISREISGWSIEDLTAHLRIVYRGASFRDKGYVGKLIESAYGCGAQNRAEPDLDELQVEIKTLPVTPQGRSLETTFVCYCMALHQQPLDWKASLVYKKLQRILWVPILAVPNQPRTMWKIGSPFLWSPSPSVLNQLAADWEELIEACLHVGLDQVSSLYGEILQLRPKALNSQVTTQAWHTMELAFPSNPKGFYLRRAFTQSILDQRFPTSA